MERIYISWILVPLLFGQSDAETWHSKNGKSYYVSPDSQATDHSSAIFECEARDSTLAVITNRGDSDFIAEETTHGENYFIGLTGPDDCESPASDACRQQWGWIDDTVSDYEDWAQERPWPGRGCGVFKGGASSGAWDAGGCGSSSTRKFICQHVCQPQACHQIACSLNNGNYQCTCEPDYTGTHCATKIDDCASDPCAHQATCDDGINSYTCECVPGYTGVHCEIDIDDCSTGPCNNGTCDDGINAFECECYDGFNGTMCTYNIDECASDPCNNNGTCEDEINGYKCLCVDDTNLDVHCVLKPNVLPALVSVTDNSSNTEEDDDDGDDTGNWIALYVGIAFLACMFILMIFTIGYYRRFMAAYQGPLKSDRPTTQEPQVDESGEITNQV